MSRTFNKWLYGVRKRGAEPLAARAVQDSPDLHQGLSHVVGVDGLSALSAVRRRPSGRGLRLLCRADFGKDPAGVFAV